MARRYRVEIDDPTLLAGYIVTPVEAENDVEAEKIAARVVYDLDDRGDAFEPIHTGYAVATQIGHEGDAPIAPFFNRSVEQLLRFERIDVRDGTFECSSGYCGWDPVVGEPHTCPQKKSVGV